VPQAEPLAATFEAIPAPGALIPQGDPAAD
jgi:hypothetical protein